MRLTALLPPPPTPITTIFAEPSTCPCTMASENSTPSLDPATVTACQGRRDAGTIVRRGRPWLRDGAHIRASVPDVSLGQKAAEPVGEGAPGVGDRGGRAGTGLEGLVVEAPLEQADAGGVSRAAELIGQAVDAGRHADPDVGFENLGGQA